MTLRILVAGTPGESLDPLVESVQEAFAGAQVTSRDLPSLFLEDPFPGPYDAAVCHANGNALLECVSRINERQSGLPVLLVSENEDPEFRDRAVSSGVASFLPLSKGTKAIVENLRLFLEMANAQKALAEQMLRAQTQKFEVGALIRLNQSLRSSIEGRPGRPRFLPLIVEADPNQAFRLVIALEKADIFAPLSILQDAEEAFRYLSGVGPYANRNRFPLPTAVVIDPPPEDPKYIELLRWIRSSRSLLHLTVLVITEAERLQEVRERFGFLANSYLVKPAEQDDLIEMLRAADLYWSSFNVLPEQR